MPANDYHFVTRWRVRAGVDEVYDILTDAKALPRWWPSVYLDVLEIQSGWPDTVDKVVRVETKGWLPYKLNWHFTVTESDPPHGFSIKAWGDFEGTGTWSLREDGDYVDVEYDWRIKAQKPVLRYGSPLFRPLFGWNHRWAMARGEESLKLELERRRAASDAERAEVPAPPPPVPMPPAPVVLGVAALVTVLLLSRRRRRSRR